MFKRFAPKQWKEILRVTLGHPLLDHRLDCSAVLKGRLLRGRSGSRPDLALLALERRGVEAVAGEVGGGRR